MADMDLPVPTQDLISSAVSFSPALALQTETHRAMLCLPACTHLYCFCAIPMTIVWHASLEVQPIWSHTNTVAFQVDKGIEGDAAGASSAVPHVIRRQSRGSQALQLARSMGSAGTPLSCTSQGKAQGKPTSTVTCLHSCTELMTT